MEEAHPHQIAPWAGRDHAIAILERPWIAAANTSYSSENIICTKLLLRGPLRLDPRLCIDLECKAAAGMAHQLLDGLYVVSIRDR